MKDVDNYGKRKISSHRCFKKKKKFLIFRDDISINETNTKFALHLKYKFSAGRRFISSCSYNYFYLIARSKSGVKLAQPFLLANFPRKSFFTNDHVPTDDLTSSRRQNKEVASIVKVRL